MPAEFSLTQVLDRPQTGRIFFEELIRENLDLGRSDHVQLLFQRRVTRQTPGRCRTRVLTEGVIPSLHVDYKNTKIKQYHQAGRALRTETTINHAGACKLGKRLQHLPALREIGFRAHRRLLDGQRLRHDCTIGAAAFRRVNESVVVDGQRASAVRFAAPTVPALFHALLVFRLLPRGFSPAHSATTGRPCWGKRPGLLPLDR